MIWVRYLSVHRPPVVASRGGGCRKTILRSQRFKTAVGIRLRQRSRATRTARIRLEIPEPARWDTYNTGRQWSQGRITNYALNMNSIPCLKTRSGVYKLDYIVRKHAKKGDTISMSPGEYSPLTLRVQSAMMSPSQRPSAGYAATKMATQGARTAESPAA